ncbi:MAG TPA: hypothetical protein VHK05_02910 [Candidatus Limnocylindrales bacterium]|nr:hypothetical protein [Candidatus Limnocylindrales bacterium]
MVVSRWFRRAGPGIAAVGAVVAIASTTFGARTPDWDPPDCVGPVGPGAQSIGAWYRIDPVLTEGAWSGQRLTLGRAGDGTPLQFHLDAESFASGPHRGTVLVGTDDGALSTLTLLDLEAGCRWRVGMSRDLIRHATLDRDRRAIVEHRVDRRDRSDLGIWLRPLDGGASARIIPPPDADPRFGRTWRTELAWSEDGQTLIVESCGEVACRFRLAEVSSGGRWMIADPSVGALVGLTGDRLIAHGACRGLPCPLLAIDVGSGRTAVLDTAAGRAVIGRDAHGRPAVIHEVGADGDTIRVVLSDGHEVAGFDLDPEAGRLVANPAWSGSAIEHPADQIVVGPDGRLPIDGSAPELLRNLVDGRPASLEEVVR